MLKVQNWASCRISTKTSSLDWVIRLQDFFYLVLMLRKGLFRLTLLLAFLLCNSLSGSQLHAQDYVDLLKVNYQLSPTNAQDSSAKKIDVEDISVSVLLPVDVNVPYTSWSINFITGLNYNRLSFYPPGDTLGWQRVHEWTLPIGKKIDHSEKFSGLYLVLPRIRSANPSFKSNQYQLGGVVLFSKQVTPKLKYKFGMYYNGEFFSPFFVPLAGLYWTPSEKWEITSTLPQYAYVYYRLHKKMQTGLGFRSSVGSFRLENPHQSRYLHKSTNELFGMLNYTVGRYYFFQVRAGYSIERYYRVYDEKDRNDWTFSAFKFGDNRIQRNQELADGLLLQFDFAFRFPIPKKEKDPELE